jgi:hypothetical protein
VEVTIKGTFTMTEDVDVESLVRAAIEDRPDDYFSIPSSLDWDLEEVEVNG